MRGFEAYERNTGQRHPNHPTGATKRDVGKESLTDGSEQLWYGTISVGTPVRSPLPIVHPCLY